MEFPRSYLVTNDEIYYTITGNIDPPTLAAVRSGAMTIWLFGYVDYIDAFSDHHRGGYGRRYDLTRPNDNLVFVTQHGYNYDRLRKRTDGNDWNQTEA